MEGESMGMEDIKQMRPSGHTGIQANMNLQLPR